ncbi:hypothetical protein SATMO3_35530 [Sporomusa aerivorans]
MDVVLLLYENGIVPITKNKMKYVAEYCDQRREIAGWSKPERDVMLKQLKEKEGLAIRQIERATGIFRGVIARS